MAAAAAPQPAAAAAPPPFLDAATLSVYVNGERKGVAVRPGMTSDYDEPVGRLEGPLRWAVDLVDDASVAIEGPLPPPAA